MEYKIGTVFKSRGKHPRVCTVRDILKTFNSKNELVKVAYVATHEFMGQIITDSNIPEVTIKMGLIKGE